MKIDLAEDLKNESFAGTGKNWWENYQEFLERQVSSDKVFFYIQEVSQVIQEFAVVKIMEHEFLCRVVFSSQSDYVGTLVRNTKENVWNLNRYDISTGRKFGV